MIDIKINTECNIINFKLLLCKNDCWISVLYNDRMGMDGESCLLLALCESGQRPQGAKGSFLEEIFHAIFT